MAEREQPANDDKIQTGGRKANAAQPLNAADDNAGAERYPPVRQDDAVQTGEAARSFDTGSINPETKPPASPSEARPGPGGGPAERKP